MRLRTLRKPNSYRARSDIARALWCLPRLSSDRLSWLIPGVIAAAALPKRVVSAARIDRVLHCNKRFFATAASLVGWSYRQTDEGPASRMAQVGIPLVDFY